MDRLRLINSPLTRYVAKRIAWAAVVLVMISFFAFLVIQLPPGDFLDSYVEELSRSGMGVDSATLVALRHSYGLDRPMIVQYWEWVSRFARGDMGVSFLYAKKVNVIIAERLPWTLMLTFGSMLVTYGIAIPIGIYTARHQYSTTDFVASFIAFIGMATPGFLLALVLMWVFYVCFGVSMGGLQSAQYIGQPLRWARVGNLLMHLPVPLVVIGIAGIANLTRTMRATLLDELGKQYVTKAREWPSRECAHPALSRAGCSESHHQLRRLVAGRAFLRRHGRRHCARLAYYRAGHVSRSAGRRHVPCVELRNGHEHFDRLWILDL